jgi:hypothetical protein
MALCSVANALITVKIEVPALGSLDWILGVMDNHLGTANIALK